MRDGGTRQQSDTNWIVCKFGGTSVATAATWSRIEEIARGHLAQGNRVLVVCSAISGVTDTLEGVVAAVEEGRSPSLGLAAVRARCLRLAEELGLDGEPLLAGLFGSLQALVDGCPRPVPPRTRAAILAHGEQLSTRLGSAWLGRKGHSAALIDARTLLCAEPGGDRADAYLAARCHVEHSPEAQRLLDETSAKLVVTQGFIARNEAGETVLLGRGGSDVSAAYLAVVAGASKLEIWTDVPGMFTANPRIVSGARMLRRVSYDEAAVLGALGAKVLHPRTIEPARAAGLSVWVRWTERPELEGTEIDGGDSARGPRAVTSRRSLLLVIMQRRASWQPVGFMAAVAGCFQRLGLSMDLIASSSSEIRATIDLSAFPSAQAQLPALLAELQEVCEPRVVESVACVSVAGTGLSPELLSEVIGAEALEPAEVHLVSHAADFSHISLVVDEARVERLVRGAHEALLDGTLDATVFGPSWEHLSGQPEPRSAPARARVARPALTAAARTAVNGAAAAQKSEAR